MVSKYENFIDGEWVPSRNDGTLASQNPADPSDTVGEFQDSTTEDVDAAVEAAVGVFDEWAATPGPERGDRLLRTAEALERRKDELSEALVREEGKAVPEAEGEVQRAIDIFQYYAQKARDLGGELRAPSGRDGRLFTRKEPIGVAGLVTPWNYPIAIPAWKLAPALAAGCPVVFKPATFTANVGRLLVECLDEAGYPGGVINYVTGSGSVVGARIAEHEDIDAVSFTGSGNVGQEVYRTASADQKRVQLEMGGKNPTVVMPSADVDEAVNIVGKGAFGVTGQACTACSRAIVHDGVYDEFVDGIVEYAETIDVGPGLDGADMGPQAGQAELEGTLEYIDVGTTEGATLLTGGGQPSGESVDSGYFVEPTVFDDVTPDMRIAREEIFGPVLAVMRIGDFDEAMDVANDVQYGLSASIVTQDLTEANEFLDRIDAGVAKVNEKTTGLELHVPFGGMKASSSETYREQGDAGLEFFTTTKTVYTNY